MKHDRVECDACRPVMPERVRRNLHHNRCAARGFVSAKSSCSSTAPGVSMSGVEDLIAVTEATVPITPTSCPACLRTDSIDTW